MYSLGFYLLGFYWIPHTLNEFGGLVFPFNYGLGFIFSFIIIPQIYFYVFLKRKISHPLFLALSYSLLEFFIPQQFPAHMGHSFLSLSPSVKLIFAPLAGASFYSFFSAFTALVLLKHFESKKKPTLHYAFILLILFSHFPFETKTQKKDESSLSVRIVQPNVGNFLKIDSEKGNVNSLKNIFDTYLFLSTDKIIHPRDLIIWPETAFPKLFFSEIIKKNSHYLPPFPIKEIIEKTNAELFIGGYDSSLQNSETTYQSDYNSAFHFSNLGSLQETYHKMKLIPFGEGLPFGPFNKFLSAIVTNISYFAEGTKYSGFITKKGQPFVSVICYEILFPSFVADMLNQQEHEAQFLINLTNDSWYGETSEPYQHLFLSKWRALEFNLPIIRSTNTGITTVIYPDGHESKRLLSGEKTYLDLELKIPQRQKTIYQKFGIGGTLFFFSILCLIELIFKRKAFFQEIMQSNKS